MTTSMFEFMVCSLINDTMEINSLRHDVNHIESEMSITSERTLRQQWEGFMIDAYRDSLRGNDPVYTRPRYAPLPIEPDQTIHAYCIGCSLEFDTVMIHNGWYINNEQVASFVTTCPNCERFIVRNLPSRYSADTYYKATEARHDYNAMMLNPCDCVYCVVERLEAERTAEYNAAEFDWTEGE